MTLPEHGPPQSPHLLPSLQLYFDAKATVIQRHWRGFWSRRSRFDFYARQRYLREVREKNEAVRAEMEVEAQRTLAVQRDVRALKGGMKYGAWDKRAQVGGEGGAF